MKIISREFDETIKVRRKIEFIDISNGFVAYKTSTNYTFSEGPESKLRNSTPSTIQQGIASEQEVRDFIDGNSISIKPQASFIISSREFLKDSSVMGFTRALDNNEIFKKDRRDFFDFIAHESGDKTLIIKSDLSSHMLFSLDGSPLPIGIIYSYMDGHFRNSSYNLEQAVEILEKLPSVKTYKIKRENFEMPLVEVPLSISEIPYYNCDEGSHHQLRFIFSPTQEQMNAIWARCQEASPRSPSTYIREAIADLDLMGIECCRVNQHERYKAPRE